MHPLQICCIRLDLDDEQECKSIYFDFSDGYWVLTRETVGDNVFIDLNFEGCVVGLCLIRGVRSNDFEKALKRLSVSKRKSSVAINKIRDYCKAVFDILPAVVDLDHGW